MKQNDVLNFLSHFYLLQNDAGPYVVLGMVLPDMVKNHRKSWNLHPSKHERELKSDPVMTAIRHGWELHLETDRRFHSSDFFRLHTSRLRRQIALVLPDLPYRPFFLAHIALELLLDSLLMLHDRVDTGKFYRQLSVCREDEIVRFLEINGIPEAPSFIPWLHNFIRGAYLFSYSDPANLAYSLDRIGRRVWQTPVSTDARDKLTALLRVYRGQLENEYLPIFEEITSYLRLL